MSVFKWLNERFEETILVFLLALISSVMMAQIVSRTFFASMTWPEEFSRYCYIWTVFLSLGYTIRKKNMLRVTVVMDFLPVKLRKSIEILTNVIMLAIFIVFFWYSIQYTIRLKGIGQFSPAMRIPMWMMYTSTIVGFGLASIRMIQEIFSNFKNFNKEIESTLEATIKEAKEEIVSTGVKIDNDDDKTGGDL